MIESYSITKIFEAEAYCACNFEGISIAACPTGLIFYQEIPKQLP
jgi:hypothetical protein